MEEVSKEEIKIVTKMSTEENPDTKIIWAKIFNHLASIETVNKNIA
jgi:hypothetical protein